MTFFRRLKRDPDIVSPLVWLLKTAVWSTLCVHSIHAATIPVLLDPHPDTRERWAAKELTTFLAEIYPEDQFPIVESTPESANYIRLTCDPNISELSGQMDPIDWSDRDGAFLVTHTKSENREIGIICGNGSKALLDGVYSLLEERLGYGFYLYRNASENVADSRFNFDQWTLQGYPLVSERICFNWYNFISGVSAWNLNDYEDWIRQAARMRYTEVMLHSYGWGPFTQFTHNGETKPVDYLQNTSYGTHWQVVHTPDVRRLIGGEVFADEGPIFGAEAGKIGYGGVTEANRVARAKTMFREAIDYAVQTVGMEFN